MILFLKHKKIYRYVIYFYLFLFIYSEIHYK